jgi:hypothetical protein
MHKATSITKFYGEFHACGANINHFYAGHEKSLDTSFVYLIGIVLLPPQGAAMLRSCGWGKIIRLSFLEGTPDGMLASTEIAPYVIPLNRQTPAGMFRKKFSCNIGCIKIAGDPTSAF